MGEGVQVEINRLQFVVPPLPTTFELGQPYGGAKTNGLFGPVRLGRAWFKLGMTRNL
jgi:hypothetical protein